MHTALCTGPSGRMRSSTCHSHTCRLVFRYRPPIFLGWLRFEGLEHIGTVMTHHGPHLDLLPLPHALLEYCTGLWCALGPELVDNEEDDFFQAGPESAPAYREVDIGNTGSASLILDAPARATGMVTAQEQSMCPFVTMGMYLDMRAGDM